MDEKRFKYYATSQMIIDNLTGKHYHGNKQVCDLLNDENDRADRIAEKYYDLLYGESKDYKKYLGEENKDLIHLQNNITNLKEVQKEDMTHYLELNDETLNVLKSFITQLQEKNIA